jgi:hypothetical protein
MRGPPVGDRAVPGYQDASFDLHGPVDHPLELLVVVHFHVAYEREILAEWMPDEAIIGEDAAQIRMSAEQNSKQIESFALEPFRAGPDFGQRIHHRIFDVLRPYAHAQPLIVRDRQQLRDDGKTFVARQRVRRGAIDAATEAAAGRCVGAPFGATIVEVVHAGQVD